MNLEDLKDQLKESFNNLRVQVEENSTFNTLRERYQTLTPNGQKGIQAGLALLVVLLLIYIPFSYFSSSGTFVADFEANRDMIRELLAASRNSKLPPPLPPQQTTNQLQDRVQGILTSQRLLPEQILGVNPIAGRPAGGLVPPAIDQSGVSVSLKTLNLRQITEIGSRLDGMGVGTKLLNFEIKASAEKENYFDVIFKIVNFSIQIQQEPEEGAGKKKVGR